MGIHCPRHGQVTGHCKLPPVNRWLCPLVLDRNGTVVGTKPLPSTQASKERGDK